MFENLELVKTIEAAGGRQIVASDLFVRRLPLTTHHFVNQRIRQAYDDLARPVRFASYPFSPSSQRSRSSHLGGVGSSWFEPCASVP